MTSYIYVSFMLSPACSRANEGTYIGANNTTLIMVSQCHAQVPYLVSVAHDKQSPSRLINDFIEAHHYTNV